MIARARRGPGRRCQYTLPTPFFFYRPQPGSHRSSFVCDTRPQLRRQRTRLHSAAGTKDTSRQKPDSSAPVPKRTGFDTTANQLLPAPMYDQYGHEGPLLSPNGGPGPAIRPPRRSRRLHPGLWSWTHRFGRFRGDQESAILSVCRQTCKEGVRILYSSNLHLSRIRYTGKPVPSALDPRGYVSPTAFLPPKSRGGVVVPPKSREGGGGKRAPYGEEEENRTDV
jgi:hypothetical protein